MTFIAAGAATPATALCALRDFRPGQFDFSIYLDSPDRVISDYPSGGGSLTDFVVAFVGREKRGLPTILTSLNQATKAQRVAIGVGLARAASACQTSDGAMARNIRKAVAGIPDRDLVQAYRMEVPSDDAPAPVPTLFPPTAKLTDGVPALPLSGDLTQSGAASKTTDPFAPLQ